MGHIPLTTMHASCMRQCITNQWPALYHQVHHDTLCYHFEYCRLILKTTHFHGCTVLDETCNMECGSSWFVSYV